MNKFHTKINFSFLFLITIFFLNFGCNETNINKEKTALKIDVVDVKQTDTTFGFFWSNFRKAVVSNDFQRLIKLTNFPLETRGPQDIDKIVKYDESKFNIVFQTFLKEDTEPDLTELDLIKKLEKFDLTNEKDFTINGSWARVGEMEFRRIDGQWKLTFLYLYYGTIDEINKKLTIK
jgi:hypothetical protein